MCCCCCRHHHGHGRGHHRGEACGSGSHGESCEETVHKGAGELKEVLEHLRARLQAVEERIAALEEG
jgi:hypothetical protein